MKKFIQSLWKEDIVKTVVTLLTGALIGKMWDSIVVPDIPLPLWVFVGVTSASFVMIALAFLSLQNSTRNLIEKSGISFDVVQEEISPDGAISGKVYLKLAELVANANREILVFNYPRTVRVRSLESNDAKIASSKRKRQEWLKAELVKLRKQQGRAFKYVMIIQTPDDGAKLTEIVDHDLAQSIHEMLSLQANNRRRDFIIDVRRSHTEFVNPFMLIDGHFLTIPLYAIIDGVMYIDKIFVFEDRDGRLIANFRSYFEQIERKSRRVTTDDL